LASDSYLNDAIEFNGILAANWDNILDAAKGNYLKVLFSAGWTLEDAKIYCEQGGLTILLTWTYDYLSALVLQVISKAYCYPDQWNQVGQPRIKYHALQLLGQIRVFARRREHMFYHNYTYLRDGQATGFQDIKLMSKRTDTLMTEVYGPSKGAASKTLEATKWSCTHCHGELHDGGSSRCDLKDIETKKARYISKKIDKRITGGETDKVLVIKEVMEAG
jgi:hypothetical protein